MRYQHFTITDFFTQINSEEKACELLWRYKLKDKAFSCSKCHHDDFYQLKCRPEIRQCSNCRFHNRLRVNTIFSNSKTPLLVWVRSIFLMMSGKRGISALELQRQLSIKSYRTAWSILHKVRHSLGQRDDQYKLTGILELDSTSFGKRATGNQEEVLIAVETKTYKDKYSKTKSKAGFAKVILANQTREKIEAFLNNNVMKGSEVRTDGAQAYVKGYEDYDFKVKATYTDHNLTENWLPWVHRFISNAKTWILGTHHGIRGHYLDLYLKEYTYRFNRRHDQNGLFTRAITACCLATPINEAALSG